MDQKQLIEFADAFFKASVDLVRTKNSDYANANAHKNAFGNLQAVETFHVDALVGFLTRMTDKLSRFATFVHAAELQVKDESITDTLRDLANYSMLAAAWIEYKKKQESADTGDNTELHIVHSFLDIQGVQGWHNDGTRISLMDRLQLRERARAIQYIATPLERAVNTIYPYFAGMDNIFKHNDLDHFSAFCHSQLSGGIGMKIRNELKLWDKESDLHGFLKREYKVEHADDMSHVILRHIYNRWYEEHPGISINGPKANNALKDQLDNLPAGEGALGSLK